MELKVLEIPDGDWKYVDIAGKEDGLRFLKFGLLRLGESEEWTASCGNDECVFLLMSGKLSFKSKNHEGEIGPRKDVFSSKAHALYVPRDSEVSFKAVYPSEVAVIRAPSREKHEIVVIRPEDVRVRVVGEMNWRRHVHDVVWDNVKADMLLVGETFNPPGNWSSYPPHRHDVDDIPNESDMEEVYHFRVFPEWGFGAQFVYTDDGEIDEVVKIKNGLTVVIDRGYHPVVAAPGYQIYYLWALAGEKRILIPRDDPKHSWIKAMEMSVKNW